MSTSNDHKTNRLQEHGSLDRARKLLREGHLDESLAIIRDCWLSHADDSEAILLLASLMREVDCIKLADTLERLGNLLIEDQKSSPDNVCTLDSHPQQAFEAAYRLIDIRQYELARMLLEVSARFSPDEPTVRYELGFTLMQLKLYEEAIDHFEAVRSIEEDFDTILNLAACYSLIRELKATRSLIKRLDKLASSEPEKLELSHRRMVCARLEQFRGKGELTHQDWLYILYGSILLFDPAEEHPLIEKSEEQNYTNIASTMLVLRGLLAGIRLEPEAVEFYSPTSRPLAAILARLFDLPLNSFQGPDRPDHALMLIDWASEIVGPHRSFTGNEAIRSIFAYGLSTTEPLPLVPDIIGHYCDNILLPWIGESRATLSTGEHSNSPEDVIPEVLERAWNLESDPDVLRKIEQLIKYYNEKRSFLVLRNQIKFPHRPEYSSEIPALKGDRA